MQRLRIEHVTRYDFASPVLLGAHQLMLRPRENHNIRIASSELEIVPAATVLRWRRDALDNSVAIASFSESTRLLAITSRVVIEHYEEAPLDFVVDASAVQHPFHYAHTETLTLAPFLQSSWPEDAAAVAGWARSIGLGAEPLETFVLLDRLNSAIHDGFTYRERVEAGVQRPALTLAGHTGSCRDFAALLIETCRSLGLASRFVSGYLHSGASQAGQGATHAWAEVYLPGPGWKGFDPTSGEVAGTAHIPVAVAQHPEQVPPVAGSFHGPLNASPVLNVDVTVHALPD
jgi:transglutaminase-like putative cysteine protease